MNDLNLSRKLAARSRRGGLVALWLMAGWLALVTPVRADNPPTFLFQWGSQGSGNGQFGTPEGIAIDSSTNVYVSDLGNRIEKFDRGGNYLTQFGSLGGGNGQIYYPEGIAVDSSNNVYLVDYGNNRIEKFDRNGNYLTQWGSYGTNNGQFGDSAEGFIAGVAVDSSNKVYVVDAGNCRIEKFDSNGNYLTKWGSLGSGNGQFSLPTGIAIDGSNNVYVADYSNNRIEKFDSNGNYLRQWGSAGTGNGQFENPEGVAVDSSNNVYVADTGNNRIEKFDSNGNYLTQWGSYGGGNGQFSSPAGIATPGNGNTIYVLDQNNSLIQVFVNNTNIPPIITSQPASQVIPVGATVSFNVTAVGAAPFSYQWASNNVALANATNSTFTLSNVSVADAVTYAVLVTNTVGGTLSSNAVLTVVPALVTTLPATGVSATNAVLNGSATVGSADATVSFDWGTDTNYGNIAGTTILPGGSGSSNLSVVLNGLPGNIYHYRLDASNALGIVQGNDVSFTVGFAPRIITNFPPINSANGATLSASVNPEGWDTTVYFKWGAGTLRTNTTVAIDAGAGATPLNISSLITGLSETSSYSYQPVASNHLGAVSGAIVTFLPPPFTGAPPRMWASVACSADGSKLVAAANDLGVPGGLYVSTNYGATWTNNAPNPNAPWQAAATSADGSKMIAAVGVPSTGPIYISTNSGTTFAPAPSAGVREWNSLASTADGTRLAAASYDAALIYVSSNSGAVWTNRSGFSNQMGFVASSADGVRLLAANEASIVGSLYTSTNAGTNWSLATNAPSAHWNGVASSANGNQLLACGYPGYVYLSTDAGATWTKTMLPMNNWNAVAESADGTKAVAAANSGSATLGAGTGGIWTSTDSGNTWVSNNIPSAAWASAAMSADGNEFVATMGYPSTMGGIYVSQITPAPVLSLAPVNGQPAVSWMIPSMGFTLQQSPDLSSWTAVTNVPVLNDTNLENQVALPLPAGNIFYRLKSN